MSKKGSNSARPRFLGEILGILLLSLSAFSFLALFSYAPGDPSFNAASTASHIQNYGGLVGSYWADLLLSTLGLPSFLLGALLFWAAYRFLVPGKQALAWSELGFLGVFLFLLSILCQLLWNKITLYNQEMLAGGLVGAVIGEHLRSVLGNWGSYLLVFSLALLSLIWATKLSVVELGKRTFKVLGVFRFWVLSKMTLVFARLKKSYSRWQAKRVEEKKAKALAQKQKVPPPKINQNKTSTPLSSSPAPTPSLPAKTVEALDASPEAVSGGPRIFKKVERKAPLKEDQLSFGTFSGNFELPAIALLDPVPEDATKQVDEESLKASSQVLVNKLQDYSVEGRVTEIHPGPVVTMYEFEPAAGVKVNKITNLADDLSLSMGGRPVRIVAPLPGKPAVGIEIPNLDRETVYFKEIVADAKFQKTESKLALALGKNIEGHIVVADLAKMPHLLVAGATGAGKSVGLNSMILSLILKNTPEEVRFIFIDPKMLELSIYEDIPHLLLPVVTQPKKATVALAWAVKEMERRYRLLSDAKVRNIASYNKKFEAGELEVLNQRVASSNGEIEPLKHEEKLPFIVIIIDELADLMMVAGREVEEYITRLAQMARAAGIHMILATQRPSVDVITGIIKANFPSRIAFKVTSKHDSRTILDTIGAEHLLGMGDMLFIPPGLSRQTRVHGAFVSDQEIQRIVAHLKEQAKPIYNEELLNMKMPTEGGPAGSGEDQDELYDQAVAIVTETRQASISMVQRRLRIGYNRAARLVEAMEAEGVVSAPMGSKGREVLAPSYDEAMGS
ncbi:MAG: DNA translocase FtsK 4TM domain-containing protein [Deltaproteobacteria bacterium]|nr:DNA translocase FtsK 4TM domain-containing protein [Deltaproteobacteria bacterium]